MKNIHLIITSAVSAFFAPYQQASAAGWTPELSVSAAFTEDSDVLVIHTNDGSTYTSGCLTNYWIFVASNEDRRGRAWATILTALTTGKKLKFYYGDTCAQWNYHSATAVMIIP